ncbi:hypothetical protein FB451DRAFT_1565981 [Mycena latifolia]|nr:hypothetical protein FB451DRAFT_1565981 [Mycena latifolia]
MSSSARQDRFHAMIIHKIPPHLSKHEFEAKLEGLIDETLQLPLVQNNLLKVQVIFQEDFMDEHVKAFGFPPREPIVLVAIHCETMDNLLDLLDTAEVRGAFEKGKEFGLHTTGHGFSAEVVAKNDNPAPKDAVHLVCVYNIPPHIATQHHDQKYEDWIDKDFLSVPAVKKHFVRFEMWMHNHALDDHIRAFGYSASGPAVIHHAMLENMDSAVEMMTDPEAHQSVLGAGNDGEHFNLKRDGYVFMGRVVTKIDKSV